MDGDIDGMVGRLEQDIAFFRGLYAYWQEDWTSAGGTDAEITVPLLNVVHDIRGNCDPGNTGRIRRIPRHYASSIVKQN